MLATRDLLRRLLPQPVLTFYRDIRAILNRWRYRGSSYYCNVCCSNLRSWHHAGPVGHRNYVCPVCNSYGRHRMMAMIIESELLQENKTINLKVLHFAPELGLQKWLTSRLPRLDYESADLYSDEADLRLDLQNITLPSNSADIVILSHVLEHVENDNLALNELRRVITPGGRLLVQVPLGKERVTIDEKLLLASERLARYGKTDHLRLYGADFQNRLISAGFEVTAYAARDEPFSSQFVRMALDLPDESSMLYRSESTVFVCQKQPGKRSL